MKLNKLAAALAAAALLAAPGSVLASTEEVSIQGDHGRLYAEIQRPDGLKSFPLVIIMHGFTANSQGRLLKDLADDLEEDGIASIRFDFNGHGKSEGRFQDMTVPNEIEDAKRVYSYANSLDGVASISLAGHSQGGVVASMTAGELGTHAVKALALMAPAAVLREDAIRGILFGKTYDVQHLPDVIPIFDNLKLGADYVRNCHEIN